MNWLGSAGLFFCPTGCWMLMLSRSEPGLKFLSWLIQVAESWCWFSPGKSAGNAPGAPYLWSVHMTWWLGCERKHLKRWELGRNPQAKAITRLLMTALDANSCHSLSSQKWVTGAAQIQGEGLRKGVNIGLGWRQNLLKTSHLSWNV